MELGQTPGSSTTSDDLLHEASLNSQSSKRRFQHAFLHNNDNLVSENDSNIAEPSIIIYDYTVDMLDEKKILVEEELLYSHEEDYVMNNMESGVSTKDDTEDEDDENVDSHDDESDKDFDPEEEEVKKPRNYIPLETKIKGVRLAKEHPNWSVKSLQRKGCTKLRNKQQLKQWENDIKNGGIKTEKYWFIDSWTYDRFLEARADFQQVTTRNIKEWALSAATQFQSTNLKFKASDRWITEFKRRHRIRQCKIQKYISQKESAVALEETFKEAEKFRMDMKAIIPNFEKKFIINTGQMRCQFRSTNDTTLEQECSKNVFVKKSDMDLTNSYTALYALTMSGELLPRVFLCLPESTGAFDAEFQNTVCKLTEELSNVFVTCSKSGSINTKLHSLFFKNIIKPYVRTNKCLLIIDSCEGQTNNQALNNEVFSDDDRSVELCTIKVIPPKLTSICHPCDVYFYRQIRNFIRRLQHCSFLIENRREIASREDIIKIHSIVHHQIAAPIFSDMLRYAWYTCKLNDDRDIFYNVNEVCFKMEDLKKNCACGNVSFIRCSRCRSNLCFPCLYDDFHPKLCASTTKSCK